MGGVGTCRLDNNILFQGRRYDKETNLYYFRARYYDPTLGRFLQTDPMGYYDSLNLYQSFKMNPANYVAPMGKWVQACMEEDLKIHEANIEWERKNHGEAAAQDLF